MNDGTFRSFFRFEQVTLAVLARHASEHGVPFEQNVRLAGGVELDAFASAGFAELPGPTLLVFKHRLGNTPQGNALLSDLRRIVDATQARSALVVIREKPSGFMHRRIVADVTALLGSDFSLRLWSLDDVAPFFQKYADLVTEMAGAGLDKIVEKGRTEAVDDWAPLRERHIEVIATAYRRNNLVLFAGAGISVDAGVPAWPRLIHSLLVSMIAKRLGSSLSDADLDRLATSQRERQTSPLLLARYIRMGLGEDFADEVARILYRHVGATKGTSPTLAAIARLCVPGLDGSGVRAVVTYNFDDLLERQLGTFGVLYRSLYRETDLADAAELGVHHVHGFLPSDEGKRELAESLLVFSEEGYHSIFMDPYSWSNVVQLGFLRERTCVFVGLSAIDPNLRRLADFAARRSSGARHYILMLREDPGVEASDLERRFDAVHHGIQEACFRELGLNVVWLRSFEEVPAVLDAIKSGGRC